MKTNLKRQTLSTTSSLLKHINYARILDLLRCHAPLTRAELARRTGLTRSTVTLITAELITQNLIKENGEIFQNPGGGRPGVGLTLNPEGAFFIGAAIEAENLTVVKMNLAAQILTYIREPFATGREPKMVLAQLAQLIRQVQQADTLNQSRLRGIGLTVPATLDLQGMMIRAPRLNWYNVDLHSYLKPHLDLPLFIDNDANAAALSEVYLSNATQCTALLYLLLDQGVGSSIIIHNKIYRGAYGTAGEICDLLIGPQGYKGIEGNQVKSLNKSVGELELLRLYREHTGGETSTLDDLVERLNHCDPLAQTVVSEWAQQLGWGLVSLVKILNPERVVLGGRLAVLLPYVKQQLNSMLREWVPQNGAFGFFSNPKASLEISRFGEAASAIGGATLVYQSIFQVPGIEPGTE